MTVPSLFVSLVAAALAGSSGGKGFAPAKPKPARSASTADAPAAAPPITEFLAWAEKEGIKTLAPIAVQDFDGVRGVGATKALEAGASVLQVPTRLALQVNSLSKCPRWCEEEAWKASKWDARLAMMLLREERDGSSELKPWLQQLPRTFDTPAQNPTLRAALGDVGYPSLLKAVDKQQREWDASRARAPDAPSKESWDWAMSVVRSRAFSGPYSPGTFVGALVQLFGAATLALGYALVVGGAGASDQALDGFLFASVFVLCNELVFGPRFTTAKRYAVCPWIDMLNHDGALGGSELAYEYFSDAFTARLDYDAGPVPQGGQCLISYGPRTNDVLLQYYGFVQEGNPHDVYAMDQEELILRVNEARPLPPDALPALKAAGLVDAEAPVTLTPSGGDEIAIRLVRLLTHPALAARVDAGRDPLPDAAAEAEAKRTLAAVARALHAKLPSEHAVPVVDAFLREKRRILEASAAALER